MKNFTIHTSKVSKSWFEIDDFLIFKNEIRPWNLAQLAINGQFRRYNKCLQSDAFYRYLGFIDFKKWI